MRTGSGRTQTYRRIDPTDRERDARALLWELVKEESSRESGPLSPEAAAVLAALREHDPARIDERLAALPSATRALLDRLSPAGSLADVQTRVFLMHDLGDTYVPFTESRRLAAGLASAKQVRLTEFALFQHVTPDADLDLRVVLKEGSKLLRHLRSVLREVL